MGCSENSEYAINYSEIAINDFAFHSKVGDQVTIKRIDRILKELETTPFAGIGNPHQLKHNYSGKWSRHLNKKDVIIYSVDEDKRIVQIYTARYHYMDK